ncbi:hypothetical protein PVA17_22635 [Lysinibacillus sp. CNPSo 3705]|uniref:hypothetical protein n=1 Tax=Lysinibacillus sp. CNPSo 3705 TaxID=3028148 RepID=UPI002363BEB8|nr:hypothetical protein [Lysinibacillus sp. CNPSo 3705]MDD1505520.1 hypothetical protein [Lysinibacillus sp. CNPSo 3705]
MAVDKNRVTFVDVPDKDGVLHLGPHSTGKKRVFCQSSKASGNFHRRLSDVLEM